MYLTLGRLTFDQMYPPCRHLMTKCGTASGRLTFGQMGPPDEALGQVNVSSDFMLARLLFFSP